MIWRVFTSGEFGRAVAMKLARRYPEAERIVLSAEQDRLAAGALHPGCNLFALDRIDEDLFAAVDEAAHEQRTMWLPVTIHGHRLQVGPLVIPGQGACWHCWRRRREQHRSMGEETSAKRVPGWSQQTYMACAASLASARSVETMARHARGDAVAGSVWTMNCLTTVVEQSTVAGVHACPRCGLGRSLPELSSRALQRACAEIWGRQEPV